MHLFNRFALVGLAAFALAVIAACGGGGDDGEDAFGLPAPGEYPSEVTGTGGFARARRGVRGPCGGRRRRRRGGDEGAVRTCRAGRLPHRPGPGCPTALRSGQRA